ncbi:MAG: L-2-amino-thiazoline-4-carboxylic acid hydrolase [Candidatus Thorarchaeota archaeon]
MKEIDRDEFWKRIVAIRANDTDPEKLEQLLIEWDRDYGPGYDELVSKVLGEELSKASAAWPKEHNIVTADDVVRDMWEGWTDGEFTIERNEEGIQIRCTKCPHADAYRAIGRIEQGLLFKCSEDPPIVRGINPEIKFTRTKSLMSGDDCCDHHYSM